MSNKVLYFFFIYKIRLKEIIEGKNIKDLEVYNAQ